MNWLAFSALAAAQFSYTLGWGSVVGVLMSELMPAAVRGLGMAVAQSAGGVANSAVSTTFIPLSAAAGLDSVFGAMGGLVLVLGMVISCWLPETANCRLEEIEKIMTAVGAGTNGDITGGPLLAEAKVTIGRLKDRIGRLEAELAAANARIGRLTRR